MVALQDTVTTTRPLNCPRNQNKRPGAEIHAGEANRKRKFTLATTTVAIKNTARAVIWKHTSVRTRENARFIALGLAARKSLLARTNSHGTIARIRVRNATFVASAVSVSWGVIISRSTQKRMDWNPAKNWRDPRIQCSFEVERGGYALKETTVREFACNFSVSCKEWSPGRFLRRKLCDKVENQ